jgi:hypothetical protein
MRRRVSPILAAVFAFVLFFPRYGLAQGATWYQFGTQGSYIHEIAHLLFGTAMIFFIIAIYQAGLSSFRGFRLLIWAWGFLAFWNFDAVVGHWADWIFYIGKIDHAILLVPAFYLFYRGLKALDRDSGAERP